MNKVIILFIICVIPALYFTVKEKTDSNIIIPNEVVNEVVIEDEAYEDSWMWATDTTIHSSSSAWDVAY